MVKSYVTCLTREFDQALILRHYLCSFDAKMLHLILHRISPLPLFHTLCLHYLFEILYPCLCPCPSSVMRGHSYSEMYRCKAPDESVNLFPSSPSLLPIPSRSLCAYLVESLRFYDYGHCYCCCHCYNYYYCLDFYQPVYSLFFSWHLT